MIHVFLNICGCVCHCYVVRVSTLVGIISAFLEKRSIMAVKSFGELMTPCLTPLDGCISSVSSPFFLIMFLLLVMKF